MTSIRQSQPPVRGQNHHYWLEPTLDRECTVRWRIDSWDAAEGSEEGGLKVLHADRDMMQVEVIGATGGTTVSAVVQCPGKEPDHLYFDVGATLSELLHEPLPDLPPDSGSDLGPLTFDAWPWPYSRRLRGLCPEHDKCSGGVVTRLFPPSIWPFYYTIVCLCDGKTLRWDLSLGIVLRGPY